MITLVYFIVDTLFTRETSFSLVSLPLPQYCFLSFIRFSRQNSFRFETVWMLRYSARFIRIEFEFVRKNFVWLFRDLCSLQIHLMSGWYMCSFCRQFDLYANPHINIYQIDERKTVIFILAGHMKIHWARLGAKQLTANVSRREHFPT